MIKHNVWNIILDLCLFVRVSHFCIIPKAQAIGLFMGNKLFSNTGKGPTVGSPSLFARCFVLTIANYNIKY